METMNLNAIAKEINDNAVAHGWWEGGRNTAQIRALIHSEWSEALEEYRASRPYHYFPCNAGGICVDDRPGENVTCGSRVYNPENPTAPCSARSKKPEGIAVELIDGCIRILDYLAHDGFVFDEEIDDLDKLMKVCETLLAEPFTKHPKDFSLPELVDAMHFYTAESSLEEYGNNSLAEAVGLACLWIKERGLDPAQIMRKKHEYNKSRSYKHGGKVC